MTEKEKLVNKHYFKAIDLLAEMCKEALKPLKTKKAREKRAWKMIKMAYDARAEITQGNIIKSTPIPSKSYQDGGIAIVGRVKEEIIIDNRGNEINLP